MKINIDDDIEIIDDEEVTSQNEFIMVDKQQ